MQDSSLNHQPQTYTFASMRSSPFFMEIDDKGGEIVQRYESFEIKIVQGGEIRYKSSKKALSRGWTWTWTKREQH